jgi:hypothetical protein
MKFHRVPKTIPAAARLLDRVIPGWALLINLSKLSMYIHDYCVLGQLYGGFVQGVEKLFGVDAHLFLPLNWAFGTYASETAWIEEINKRLVKRTRVVISKARIRQAHKDDVLLDVRNCFLAKSLELVVKPEVRVTVGAADMFYLALPGEDGDEEFNAGPEIQAAYSKAFNDKNAPGFSFYIDIPVRYVK